VIDENAIDDAEANILENVCNRRKIQRRGVSANQKRVIRKKAVNFRIVNGKMIFKKKCRGKEEVYVWHNILMVMASLSLRVLK